MSGPCPVTERRCLCSFAFEDERQEAEELSAGFSSAIKMQSPRGWRRLTLLHNDAASLWLYAKIKVRVD